MISEDEVNTILDSIRDPVTRTFDIIVFANKVVDFTLNANAVYNKHMNTKFAVSINIFPEVLRNYLIDTCVAAEGSIVPIYFPHEVPNKGKEVELFSFVADEEIANPGEMFYIEF